MVRFLFLIPALALVLTSGAFAQYVGTSFCNPTSNSTGLPTLLLGDLGSGAGSNLHLEVLLGVPGEFGYFLAGNEATAGVATSNGMLCLVGTGTAALYRYNVAGGGSNSVGVFDASGVLQNLAGTSTTGSGFDVPGTIPGSVPITIMSGDTWHFQFWHRDTPAAQGTSNFSNGLSVTFPPTAHPLPISGMVQIPAGLFSMGSDAAAGVPYFGSISQQPVHSVTISQGFWMGETEVTQAEYQTLMGAAPSEFPGANRPVETVNWEDARAYCTALTAQEQLAGHLPAGYEYRLPTEAEWEYACRAGTTTEFSVGPDLFCTDAKFRYSYHSNSDCNSTSTTVVGSYPANAFGLYDMQGNVFEWCLDSAAGYAPGPVTDPLEAGGTLRIIRGGSWTNYSASCRSAFRAYDTPLNSNGILGFRVVLGLVLVP